MNRCPAVTGSASRTAGNRRLLEPNLAAQASAPGQRGRRGAIVHPQLDNQCGQLIANRLGRQMKPPGYRRVIQTPGHQVEQHQLAIGQGGELVSAPRPPGRAEQTSHPLGDTGTKDQLARSSGPDRPRNLASPGAFEQIAPGTCRHGRKQRLIVVIQRQHQATALGMNPPELADHGHPAPPWQMKIEQYDRRAQPSSNIDPFAGRPGLANYHNARMSAERRCHSVTDDRVIIHQHHRDLSPGHNTSMPDHK
jgi:hypothetical protein